MRLDEIVENQAWLRKLAISLAGDAAQAEDLVQDTLESAVRQPPKKAGNVRGWLAGVLRNRWRMNARATARQVAREDAAAEPPVEEQTPDATVERAELYGVLCRLVGELDEPYRATLLLRYAEDLDAPEIAARLGVDAGTVRVRLSRARARLRNGLEQSVGKRRTYTVLGAFLLKGAAMKIPVKITLLAVAALLFVLGGIGGYVWHRAATDAAASDPIGWRNGLARSPLTSPRAAGVLPAWFGEPDRAPRTIAGRVVYRGEPVPRAAVVVTSELTRAGVAATLKTTTDDDGVFRFPPLRAAVYDVTATAAGFGYAYETIDTRAKALPPPDALVLRLPGCDDALYGEIRDASGGTVEGARITPTRDRGAATRVLGVSAESGDDGSYELCTTAGRHAVVVSAAGYGAVHVEDTVVGRRRLDVELVPEATIIGRAERADNGEPVPGALVTLMPSAWQGSIRTTIETTSTDAEGRFRFSGLAPGRHLVFAKTAELYVPALAVVVDAGVESRQILLRLETTHAVRGTVVQSGRPVPGARVTAKLPGLINGTVADDNGRFVIRLARTGVVQFEVEDYEVLSPVSYDATSPNASPAVVEVRQLGVIRGKVIARGDPVAGAEVAAVSPAYRGGRPSDVSDFNGEFELRGLPAGKYVVFAQGAGARAFSRDEDVQHVSLGDGEVREGVVVELGGAALIEGVVRDQAGDPVSGVYVQYTSVGTDDLCRSVTGDDGTFSCAMLAGYGDYVPMVKPTQSSAVPLELAHPDVRVQVPRGDSVITDQRLTVLTKRRTIAGRVVTQTGGPFPDVPVRASESATGRSPSNSPWVGFPFGISDGDGHFEIDVWGNAGYTLHARSSGGSEATIRDVRPGASNIVVRLDEPGAVRGKLVGFEGRPAVHLRRIGTVESTPANVSDGEFTVTGLAPGSYAALAVRDERAAAETVEVRAGKTTEVTLEARATATVDGRVSDFITGDPIPGVTCSATPYVAGASMFGWGAPRRVLSETDGTFSLAVPSGAIELYCQGQARAYSDGIARTTLTAGETGEIEVPVVSKVGTGGMNAIGARLFSSGGPHKIIELRPGGSAEVAGLAVGDVVRAIDGRDVRSLTGWGVLRLIGNQEVGSTVKVTIDRGKHTREFELKIEPPWG